MKAIILTLTTLMSSAISQYTDYDLVHLYLNGTIIEAEHLEKGEVNFFRSIAYESHIVSTRNGFSTNENVRVERYFLGTEEDIEEITPYNYKTLIKTYLPNAPELHKRLGRKGFRFENIQYMIRFYNKFKTG